MRAVTLPGIALAVVGVVLGGVAARSVVQVLQSLVWGVRPTDPLTFAAVALLLLAVAATASLIPALRIARLNPAETLRQE
jgi:putative ABC transport system permease protein